MTTTLKLPNDLDPSRVLLALIRRFEDAPYVSALRTATPKDTPLPPKYHTMDWMLGIGLNLSDADTEPIQKGLDFGFEDFESLLQQRPGFRMGYMGYDLKAQSLNQPSPLPPSSVDPNPWFWFLPRLRMVCQNGQITVIQDDHQIGLLALQTILGQENGAIQKPTSPTQTRRTLRDVLKAQTSPNEYRRTVNLIKDRIKDGDFYELNYCVEWAGPLFIQDPVGLWEQWSTKAAAPFSALVKNKELWVLCASPERFLRKDGDMLCSQPIKGTAPRSEDPSLDHLLAANLATNPKENAEHLMIVDLVRNDLARCGDPCSVEIQELMKGYTFPTVHHLISSIQAQCGAQVGIAKILKACFPMGSMTGAPKEAVCSWIDRFEKTRRGIYSGCLGWLDEHGHFDLNVIIRTLVYNQDSQKASLKTGGAITWDSDPETEWLECQTKAQGLLDLGFE
ncbi:MAG: chorismate-binding protein [Bacteroidota bacterium]